MHALTNVVWISTAVGLVVFLVACRLFGWFLWAEQGPARRVRLLRRCARLKTTKDRELDA